MPYPYRSAVITALLFLIYPCLWAATANEDWNVTALRKLLANVPPGQNLVQLGDEQVPTAYLQNWCNHLAGGPQPKLAFDQYFTAWPNGNVYYSFDSSVSAPHQKAFRDAAGEWATFANLHFIPRTNEANYVVVTNSPSLDGGVSAVGMVGGPQLLQIGPTAWNRPTLCHELGHTLGLVHEHQRSDRDNYVSIITSNILSGYEFDFIVLPGSLNQTAYDFLSVMHYRQNAFSVTTDADTIVAHPPYAQYQNLMGNQYDPVLSLGDRVGMAKVYGAGPVPSSVVTNTADSGPGTLRAALHYAFDNPGTTITFDIPASDPGYSNNVFNFLPTDAFPSLVNGTVLDGSSEPIDSNPNGPALLLSGALSRDPSVYPNGLQFRGSNCVVRSFVINNFPNYGVILTGSNTSGNAISGCYLGTDASGMAAVSNGIVSLQIMNGAHDNTIGGLTAASRNVIGGSIYQGMVIRDPGSDHNTVEGNYLGLNASGTAPLPTAWSGLQIFGGARSNLIGGYTSAARNIIAGNSQQGIVISETNSDDNVIAGNYIGLDPTGSFAIPNGWAGVEIFGGAKSNIVGGDSPAARNVISGNNYQGVLISDNNSDENVVAGNYVGVDPTGAAALPNGWSGVEVFGGSAGSVIGPANVISGNLNYGVVLSQPGTRGNVVEGNVIGLNAAGSLAIGNHYAGVGIYGGGQSNQIGGSFPGQGNLISGNLDQGVAIGGLGTQGNLVRGNYIGVDTTGASAIGNGLAGVNLYGGAAFNEIGGNDPGSRNVISGNHAQGILLQDSGTKQNVVLGNLVGLNAMGAAALSNAWTGIELYNGVSGNQIGGLGEGRNFVSGNGIYGIALDDFSRGNFIQGNTIGLDAANTEPVPNTYAAVALYGGSTSNWIGGTFPGAANLIANSSAEGVLISDASTSNNTVRGNSVFSCKYSAIALYNGANNNAASPALATATTTTNCIITGSFKGAAGTSYLIDFYADAPPAGVAQAKTHLESRPVTGTGSTTAFTAALGAHLPLGRSITASATDPAGNTSALSTGIATTMISSVNDGIPDAWRARYFGGSGTTTNNLSAATADPDHDGLNNLQEFLAGTDPTKSASVLDLTAIGPAFSTNTVILHSADGIVYQIWFSDDLAPATWSILADQVVGTGGDIPVAVPGGGEAGQRFYRAKVVW